MEQGSWRRRELAIVDALTKSEALTTRENRQNTCSVFDWEDALAHPDRTERTPGVDASEEHHVSLTEPEMGLPLDAHPDVADRTAKAPHREVVTDRGRATKDLLHDERMIGHYAPRVIPPHLTANTAHHDHVIRSLDEFGEAQRLGDRRLGRTRDGENHRAERGSDHH